MRILITNDDGVNSEGIRAVIRAALLRGHQCQVAAPEKQCSANSQHITLTKAIPVNRAYPVQGLTEAYAVRAKPADCVRISANLFSERADICISGVNEGENAGAAVYYSGTVSAAREAAMLGYKAVAVSVVAGATEKARDFAALKAVEWAEKLVEENIALPRLGVVNLNFPASDPENWKEMRVSTLSNACFLDVYTESMDPETGERCFRVAPGIHTEEPEEGSDWYYLRRGYPTCTLLSSFSDQRAGYETKLQEILHKTCKG